ncbi:regulatory protein RecX [Vibrio cyclitrophicus]|uniref:regulatory protein RecX n=1 Tax=Vibrio cyclitrophicus TaxID=47951 RepID=UPI001F5417EA|nr:regulatory protein RecX [Vibrio cyclitrophicus]
MSRNGGEGYMGVQELYDQAVELLAKRDYSSGDLRYQLSRLAESDTVEQVMEKLLSHHYVNDERLIEREIEKQLLKRHGSARIKQELRKKGLDSLLIEQALEDLDVDWFELCLEAKQKKFGEAKPKDMNEKGKMIRYLQYRGHTMSCIMETLSD